MLCSRPLSDKDLAIIDRHVKSSFARAEALGRHLFCLHRETNLSIRVPLADLQKNANSYNLIKGKARLENGANPSNYLEVDCLVACSCQHLARLPSDQKEIDIIQNLDNLLPSKNLRKIELVTCQNGIQNSFATPNRDGDFEKMCLSVTSHLKKKKPLFIGLYNPTSGIGTGIVNDLQRLLNEWSLNISSVLTLRQLFATLCNKLSDMATRNLWLHIAHSEGGLLAQNCLTHYQRGLTPHQKNQVKKHLITLVFGGVSPISDEACYQQMNIYSNKDIALKLNSNHLDKMLRVPTSLSDKKIDEFAKQYEQYWRGKVSGEDFSRQLKKGRDQSYINKYPHRSKKNGFTLEIVESIVKNLPLIEGDHAFLGETYQRALTTYLTKLSLI